MGLLSSSFKDIKQKSSVCTGANWPIQPECILISIALSGQEYHCSPPSPHDGILVDYQLCISILSDSPHSSTVHFYISAWREALLELSVFPTTQHEDLGKSKTRSLLPRVQCPNFRAIVVLILHRYHVSQPPNVCCFIKFQITFSGLAEWSFVKSPNKVCLS